MPPDVQLRNTSPTRVQEPGIDAKAREYLYWTTEQFVDFKWTESLIVRFNNWRAKETDVRAVSHTVQRALTAVLYKNKMQPIEVPDMTPGSRATKKLTVPYIAMRIDKDQELHNAIAAILIGSIDNDRVAHLVKRAEDKNADIYRNLASGQPFGGLIPPNATPKAASNKPVSNVPKIAEVLTGTSMSGPVENETEELKKLRRQVADRERQRLTEVERTVGCFNNDPYMLGHMRQAFWREYIKAKQVAGQHETHCEKGNGDKPETISELKRLIQSKEYEYGKLWLESRPYTWTYTPETGLTPFQKQLEPFLTAEKLGKGGSSQPSSGSGGGGNGNDGNDDDDNPDQWKDFPKHVGSGPRKKEEKEDEKKKKDGKDSNEGCKQNTTVPSDSKEYPDAGGPPEIMGTYTKDKGGTDNDRQNAKAPDEERRGARDRSASRKARDAKKEELQSEIDRSAKEQADKEARLKKQMEDLGPDTESSASEASSRAGSAVPRSQSRSNVHTMETIRERELPVINLESALTYSSNGTATITQTERPQESKEIAITKATMDDALARQREQFEAQLKEAMSITINTVNKAVKPKEKEEKPEKSGGFMDDIFGNDGDEELEWDSDNPRVSGIRMTKNALSAKRKKEKEAVKIQEELEKEKKRINEAHKKAEKRAIEKKMQEELTTAFDIDVRTMSGGAYKNQTFFKPTTNHYKDKKRNRNKRREKRDRRQEKLLRKRKGGNDGEPGGGGSSGDSSSSSSSEIGSDDDSDLGVEKILSDSSTQSDEESSIDSWEATDTSLENENDFSKNQRHVREDRTRSTEQTNFTNALKREHFPEDYGSTIRWHEAIRHALMKYAACGDLIITWWDKIKNHKYRPLQFQAHHPRMHNPDWAIRLYFEDLLREPKHSHVWRNPAFKKLAFIYRQHRQKNAPLKGRTMSKIIYEYYTRSRSKEMFNFATLMSHQHNGNDHELHAWIDTIVRMYEAMGARRRPGKADMYLLFKQNMERSRKYGHLITRAEKKSYGPGHGRKKWTWIVKKIRAIERKTRETYAEEGREKFTSAQIRKNADFTGISAAAPIEDEEATPIDVAAGPVNLGGSQTRGRDTRAKPLRNGSVKQFRSDKRKEIRSLADTKKIACKFHKLGTCKFGNDCRYSHDANAAPCPEEWEEFLFPSDQDECQESDACPAPPPAKTFPKKEYAKPSAPRFGRSNSPGAKQAWKKMFCHAHYLGRKCTLGDQCRFSHEVEKMTPEDKKEIEKKWPGGVFKGKLPDKNRTVKAACATIACSVDGYLDPQFYWDPDSGTDTTASETDAAPAFAMGGKRWKAAGNSKQKDAVDGKIARTHGLCKEFYTSKDGCKRGAACAFMHGNLTLRNRSRSIDKRNRDRLRGGNGDRNSGSESSSGSERRRRREFANGKRDKIGAWRTRNERTGKSYTPSRSPGSRAQWAWDKKRKIRTTPRGKRTYSIVRKERYKRGYRSSSGTPRYRASAPAENVQNSPDSQEGEKVKA